MSDENDKHPFKAAMDIANGISEFVDDHEDEIESIQEAAEEVMSGITGDSEVKTTYRESDNEAEVCMAVEEGVDHEEVEVKEVGDRNLEINTRHNSVKVKPPKEANIDDREVKIKNGIITLTIPRGE